MTDKEFIESIKLDGEEWRDVVGNSRYAVSSFGRVVSYSYVYRVGNRVCHKKPKLMKIFYKKDEGYAMIGLYEQTQVRKCKNVHRLVAEAFLPNPNNYNYVNHKDENPSNNHVENLEWCTQQYNCNYKNHNRKLGDSLKINSHKRKVVWLSVNNEYLGTFNSIKEASETSKASPTCIRDCCRKPGKILCGYKWAYYEDYYK